MSNAVSICSNALLILGAQPINDFNEDLDRARIASNLYEPTRDEILRSHPWNCAVRRVLLSPEENPPKFDYSHRFPLPSDWLRTISVGDYGAETSYKTEEQALLSDANPLKLRYIFRNSNEATWDASLIGALTLAMAQRMAYAITQSASMEQIMAERLGMALRQARAVDGQDDPPETLGDFPLLASRH